MSSVGAPDSRAHLVYVVGVMRNQIKNSHRGLALVTVLWVLVLLALIAASFTLTTRTEVNITRNLIDNAQAEALADAGVYWAILGLLQPGTVGVLNLLEQHLRRSAEGGGFDLAPGAIAGSDRVLWRRPQARR